MAFAGSVLTPMGWRAPEHDLDIACADNGQLVWKRIKECHPITLPALVVESRDIAYTASSAQELYQPGRKITIMDIISRLRAAKGRRINISHRISLSSSCQPTHTLEEILDSLAYLEWLVGGVRHPAFAGYGKRFPVMSSGFIPRVVGYREVWNGASDLFRLDAGMAGVLSSLAERYRHVRYASPLVSSVMQFAVILSGGSAVVRGGRVVVSRNRSRPLEINSSCRISAGMCEMSEIDVRHPLVMLGGRVTVL